MTSKERWPKAVSASKVDQALTCHGALNLPAAIPGWVDGVPAKQNQASLGSKLHLLLAEAAGLKRAELSAVIRSLQYLESLRAGRNWKMLIEEPQEVKWLPSRPGTTADLVLYVQDEIHVIDWKMGKIRVDPADNSQLKYYALTYAPYAPKAKGVFTHIVQPMAKEWDETNAVAYYSTQELEDFGKEVIAADVAIAAGSLKMVPGDHCMFCPANPHVRGTKGSPSCPAMLKLLYPERAQLQENLISSFEEDENGSLWD